METEVVVGDAAKQRKIISCAQRVRLCVTIMKWVPLQMTSFKYKTDFHVTDSDVLISGERNLMKTGAGAVIVH